MTRLIAFALAAALATAPLLGGAAPSAAAPHALLRPLAAHSTRLAAQTSAWGWPLAPRPALVRGFDPPARPWLSGHRGVDLAAASGQQLLAPEGGTVVFAGWVVDRPVLTIRHPDGHRSSFEPVTTELAAGAEVTRGEPIGKVAAEPPHCAEGCVHWGVRRDDDYVDPLRLVADTRPSILLPWTGRASP
ncbi:M23 family metallopeptidase [Sinomonas sp. JGH33]|uniref:M23 family metallopeptidase n=1 Tax=Sinomonas terricola TaxID=3110330 RepID=A0ABU5T657_9MICC|nr:M23 family metallopeptidase [Sinomonas sp. JGH33]MEA5454626.1 M23 family metallopeptidase [Sinomonas sp. JGH33]